MNLIASYPQFFWDIDQESTKSCDHPVFTIERILERGNLQSIEDLFKAFSKEEIIAVVKESRKISKRTARFWQVCLKIEGTINCLEKESPTQLSKLWE